MIGKKENILNDTELSMISIDYLSQNQYTKILNTIIRLSAFMTAVFQTLRLLINAI